MITSTLNSPLSHWRTQKGLDHWETWPIFKLSYSKTFLGTSNFGNGSPIVLVLRPHVGIRMSNHWDGRFFRMRTMRQYLRWVCGVFCVALLYRPIRNRSLILSDPCYTIQPINTIKFVLVTLYNWQIISFINFTTLSLTVSLLQSFSPSRARQTAAHVALSHWYERISPNISSSLQQRATSQTSQHCADVD